MKREEIEKMRLRSDVVTELRKLVENIIRSPLQTKKAQQRIAHFKGEIEQLENAVQLEKPDDLQSKIKAKSRTTAGSKAKKKEQDNSLQVVIDENTKELNEWRAKLDDIPKKLEDAKQKFLKLCEKAVYNDDDYSKIANQVFYEQQVFLEKNKDINLTAEQNDVVDKLLTDLKQTIRDVPWEYVDDENLVEDPDYEYEYEYETVEDVDVGPEQAPVQEPPVEDVLYDDSSTSPVQYSESEEQLDNESIASEAAEEELSEDDEYELTTSPRRYESMDKQVAQQQDQLEQVTQNLVEKGQQYSNEEYITRIENQIKSIENFNQKAIQESEKIQKKIDVLDKSIDKNMKAANKGINKSGAKRKLQKLMVEKADLLDQQTKILDAATNLLETNGEQQLRAKLKELKSPGQTKPEVTEKQTKRWPSRQPPEPPKFAREGAKAQKKVIRIAKEKAEKLGQEPKGPAPKPN